MISFLGKQIKRKQQANICDRFRFKTAENPFVVDHRLSEGEP